MDDPYNFMVRYGRELRRVFPKSEVWNETDSDHIAVKCVEALCATLNCTEDEIRGLFKTEDEKVFGKDALVYCRSHLNPHRTGWCTVQAADKVLLRAKTVAEAEEECRARGFTLYDDIRR